MLDELPRYDDYSDSGVRWLGSVPSSWSTSPLIALAKPRSISGHPDYELLSVYLDRGVIRFSDVDEKRTNATSEDLSNYQVVEVGDFVLNNQQAWRGSVGVSEHQGIVSPAYIVLELSDKLSPRFANYLFRDSSMVAHYLVCSKGVGTIQRNLYWPKLKRVPVFYPDLDTQNRIVSFLDEKTAEIDAAIAKKRRLIDLLNEQKAILINRAVTKGLNPNTPMKDSGVDWIGEIPAHWEVKRVKHVTSRIVDGTHFTPTYVDAGVPFLRVTDLTKSGNAEIDWEETRRIPEKEHKELAKRALPRRGDVLLSKNGTIGLTKVVEWDHEVSIFVSLCLIRPTSLLNPHYFAFFFNSPVVDEQLTFGSKRTSVTNLHLDKIKELLILLPPEREQEEIVRSMNSELAPFFQAIELVESEISTLNEFKQTLIANAVTGKIKI